MGFIKKIIEFLSKDNMLPLISGVAAGAYPMAFYYSRNFNFVNSLSHLIFFSAIFLALPIAVNYLCYLIYKKNHLSQYKTFVLPALNGLAFFILAIVAIDSKIGNKKFAIAVGLAFLVAFASLFLKRKQLFSKVIFIQFILLLVVMYPLSKTLYSYFISSDSWMEQPDHIEKVVLKQRPNIYVIQPDGYVNPSELKKGHYNFDNSAFENKLAQLGFKIYQNFRSNYPSTLSSNSSLFAMKHHFFNQVDERNSIMNKNPVVEIFKNNGYKTHFLAEVPYLLANKPNVSFDYINFKMSEISFLGRGLSLGKHIIDDVKPLLESQKGANFYFFEKLQPGHIKVYKEAAGTIEEERQEYLNELQQSNVWLEELIGIIQQKDPNGLIVIVADHGGYVGWEYSLQSHSKTNDRDLLYSGFSTLLAIKWNEEIPNSDDQLKSSVNLFRVLFSHLSEDTTLLDNLQDNSSYNQLKLGKPLGVFKVLDSDGNVVFEKP